jgi:hypothetical protein
MPIMSYNVEVLRGWPNDGARDNYETPKALEVNHQNGDLVQPTTGNVVTNLGITGTAMGVGAGNGCFAGLVMSGAQDSGSAAYAGNEVVLWGNAIVRVATTAVGDATNGYLGHFPALNAAGQKVTCRATANGAKLRYDLAGTGDAVVGFVKEVNTLVAGINTANIVIVLF